MPHSLGFKSCPLCARPKPVSDPHPSFLKYLGESHISDKCLSEVLRLTQKKTEQCGSGRSPFIGAVRSRARSKWGTMSAECLPEMSSAPCSVNLVLRKRHRSAKDMVPYPVRFLVPSQLKARSLEGTLRGSVAQSTALLQRRVCYLWNLCQIHQGCPLKFLFIKPKTQSQY